MRTLGQTKGFADTARVVSEPNPKSLCKDASTRQSTGKKVQIKMSSHKIYKTNEEIKEKILKQPWRECYLQKKKIADC